MTIKRVTRQTEPTPEERERIKAAREKMDAERPSPDDLIASGEYEGPVQLGTYWEVRQLMAALKAERERQGLTLSNVEESSGIDKATLSRLETGKQTNPTIDTVSRIASALGKKVGLVLYVDESGQAGQHGSEPVPNKTSFLPSVTGADLVDGCLLVPHHGAAWTSLCQLFTKRRRLSDELGRLQAEETKWEADFLALFDRGSRLALSEDKQDEATGHAQ